MLFCSTLLIFIFFISFRSGSFSALCLFLLFIVVPAGEGGGLVLDDCGRVFPIPGVDGDGVGGDGVILGGCGGGFLVARVVGG